MRLLGDESTPTHAARHAFEDLARRETSGLVLLYLASSLQEFPSDERWELAESLSRRAEFATDRVLPLMIWYGIEPAVANRPARAVQIAESSPMLPLVRSIARRLTENIAVAPEPVNQLVELLQNTDSWEWRQMVLGGMVDSLRGYRKAAMPESWSDAQQILSASPEEEVRRLTQELSVVFGDGRALDELMQIAATDTAEPTARRDAIRVLAQARGSGVSPLLRELVDDRDVGANAVRALAVFDDAEIPGVLIAKYGAFRQPTRAAAIVTLSSRPAWSAALLQAVAAGQIDRTDVPAFQVRQLAAYPDSATRQRVAELWPALRPLSASKRARIAELEGLLDATRLATADLSNGRWRFVQSCSTCHTLFGEGAKTGPSLTGAQRSNLAYLLENVVDPSATVSPGYHMSSITLTDGRVLNGLVHDASGSTFTVQTPTEQIAVNRSDVESIQKSELSLMPDGLLDSLPENEARDLIAYLMSPVQVPLPAHASVPVSKP